MDRPAGEVKERGKKDRNGVVRIGMVLSVITVLVAFAAYRWQPRARVRRVNEWVKGYLVTRYGAVPAVRRSA